MMKTLSRTVYKRCMNFDIIINKMFKKILEFLTRLSIKKIGIPWHELH